MTDTIASRVTRVIGGSVHALLDAVENAAPEAAMAQAIREVDQATDEVRAELGRVEAVKHLANSSLNKLNSHNETLAGQIEIAMAKGDEGLARAGIAKRAEVLCRIETERARRADCADGAVFSRGAVGLAAVFDNREVMTRGHAFEARHVRGLPIEMHRHNGLCP